MIPLLQSPLRLTLRRLLPATHHRCFAASSPRSSAVGVAAVLEAAKNPAAPPPAPTLFKAFSLQDRVAVVSGANRGIGLEMSLALAEAGARVYALDLPPTPGADFQAVQRYVDGFGTGASLSYIEGGVDVTDQKRVWDVVAAVGDKEGRVDVGIAAAGILNGAPALEYEATDFQKVIDVNVNGVLHTAQAVGRQMTRFGLPGSIILIASVSGSITNKDHAWVAYNTSKSAVLQMARSMACELGPQAIRVNTVSPGHILTDMTKAYLETEPGLYEKWASFIPLGRLATPDELRGVVSWLASDASSFCTGSDILVTGGYHAW